MRRLLTSGMWALLALAVATPARSQNPDDRLRAQRDSLDRIRRERDSLRSKMTEMQGRVHDLSDEVSNLHSQADATARLVKSLDGQLASLDTEVKTATERLSSAEAEVATRRVTLKKRIADIYKRGPLFATEALLSARTFGELIARYKYLHELAVYDRSIVQHVEGLYAQIDSQRQLLVRLQDEFARNRQEKAAEEERLRDLEQQRQRSLAQAKQTTQQIQDRLTRIQHDEERVTQLIAAADEARRRAGPTAAPSASTSTLRTSDFGKLDWPVDGEIIYRFGRAINPNNTAIRWNGIGIKAPLNTPVRAIAAGEVMVADVIGTYGLTIIVQHGDGDYSVYGSLSRADVKKGMKVLKGQVIGAVGQADPDMDPHLHLEIRPKGRATDPLAWLQEKK